jgi:hypothetical protein
MADSDFCKVDVSEGGHGNTYVVRVLQRDQNELVGVPIKNSNKRIYVDKNEDTVRFLKGHESFVNIDDLRTAELRSIRNSVPDWVEEL